MTSNEAKIIAMTLAMFATVLAAVGVWGTKTIAKKDEDGFPFWAGIAAAGLAGLILAGIIGIYYWGTLS
jgi:hypothetical protein